MEFDFRTFDEELDRQRQFLQNVDVDKAKKDDLESRLQALAMKAKKFCEKGDIIIAMVFLPNTQHLNFVFDNLNPLREIGKYEEALLHAYIAPRTNFADWPFSDIRFLFDNADPDKLRVEGDSIPDQKEFTLYRGVSGKGRARRVNGYSWTESPNIAAWFAMRFADLEDPAVFKITVPREQILACSHDKNEKEYILKLPLPKRPRRLKEMPEPKSKTSGIG
jgi:hypothetical protein